MAFDPFSSSSRDFYGQSRFSDLVGRQASTKVGLIGDAVANKNYILAAKRAAKYQENFQKEMMNHQAKLARQQQGSSSRSGLFGTIGRIAGGVLGSVVPGVGTAIGSAVGGALGGSIG
jgi:hypothetical protein